MKKSLLAKFAKNLLLFGSLFIIVSVVVDWYRKPAAPAEQLEKVLYDLEQNPKVIAQMGYEKPVLLYFWGSWCHFCEYTTPAVQRLADQGTQVVSVALQSGSDEEVKRYLAENGYRFSTINDPSGALLKAWGIQATPTVIILKKGKIINHTTGLTSEWGIKFRLWLADFS